MKKLVSMFAAYTVLATVNLFAQAPANDNCTGAVVQPQNGSCLNGTTVGATDSWSTTGGVGCQTANNSPDVWYTFTATGTVGSWTLTNITMTGNIEFVLVIPNCANNNCSCPFLLVNSTCGPSVLNVQINTLTVGQTYFYTISSSTGSQGTFQTCLTVSNPPPAPGQDCPLAQELCTGTTISVPNINLGPGAIYSTSNANAENLSLVSCLASDEHASQWYQFTCGAAGTFEFSIDPTNWTAPQTGDDYDWALWDITSNGCNIGGTGNTALACNYSACRGATGLSPTFFGLTGGVDYMNNNPIGPLDCTGGPQWNTAAVNLQVGHTYALIVDNYSTNTGGFTLDFGGTAVLGPVANFTVSQTDCSVTCTMVNLASPTALQSYYWTMGDGNTYTTQSVTHTYALSGSYTISLQVTDALGCINSYSVPITCVVLPVELLSFTAAYNSGGYTELNWATATETNNRYFVVERSNGITEFAPIDTVASLAGPGGNSVSTLRYSAFDNTIQGGATYYYRLRQVDHNGDWEYSNVTSVPVPSMKEMFSVIPNPATDHAVVNVMLLFDQDFSITIHDVAGRVVETFSSSGVTGNNTIELDLGEYNSSMYYITTEANGTVYRTKLVKE